MLTVNVTGQVVNVSGDSAVSGAENYIKAKFCFDNSWENHIKTVIFRNPHTDIAVSVILMDGNPLYLGDNTCLVPHEVITEPEFTICVSGVVKLE